MKTQTSQENRRLAVLCHYAAAFALMIQAYIFLWSRTTPPWLLISTAAVLAIFYMSFRFAHTRTGIWTFIWAKSEQLDERELQLTRDTFHRSYRIFAAVVVGVAIAVSILNKSYLSQEAYLQHRPFNAAPLLLALAHFAKTLPSSILAWGEREVPRERELI